MEEFRELPEYPGYRIGNQGTIIGYRLGKPLKPAILKSKYCDYYRVCLCMPTYRQSILVHRLVALAWIPNTENKPEVDHIDRNTFNNRVENLRWVTRTENSNNMKMSNANKTGITGLSYDTRQKRWIADKVIMKMRHLKVFQERSDAEAYLATLAN